MKRLENKIALVTGGAKGLGKSIVELFVQHGAQIIITDILDKEGQDLAKKIGHNAIYCHLDVAQEQDWQDVSKLIEQKFGYLDILVNNAGITGLSCQDNIAHDPEYVSLEDWQYVHKINVDGTFLGCKYGIKLIKKRPTTQSGAIINMSSRSGIVGIPTTAAYASSKAAIRNHTKTVALYCASKNYNIRCNSIHPGAVLTDIWQPMIGDDNGINQESQQKLASSIPLGKMGQPIDVAYCALYLASEESKYMTGSEIILDGGILAGSAAAPVK